MLKEMVDQKFGQNRGFHCAEIIVGGANESYRLGLSPASIKLAGGFGGGIYSENVCGALLGAIMVLGTLFIDDHANESEFFKEVVREYLKTFEASLGEIYCAPLKTKHRTPELKCHLINLTAAEIIDCLIDKYKERLQIDLSIL